MADEGGPVAGHGEAAEVRGGRLRLRLIEPDDAAYVHGLRSDPRYNTHLSPVSGGVEDQRAWIEGYKAREASGREFYYVIERLDGVRCGLVRLYDIDQDSFTWGSWILDENKPPKAALESAVLLYRIAFEQLGIPKAVFDVRRGNEHTLAFHRRFGAVETGADEQDIFFEYPREQYRRTIEAHNQVLSEGLERA
jgi:RimJ/RimL family protein N-acetyltransferase